MRLSEYVRRDRVIAELAATDKPRALTELAAMAAGSSLDAGAVNAVLLDRERLGTTAVGGGIAIPHGKMPGLTDMVLVFARSGKGIDFGAPDGKPCHLFFTVLAPEGAAGKHLGLLGAIARLSKDSDFTARLMQAQTADELADFLSAA